MRLQIPQYNGADNQVFLITTPLFTLLLNGLNFGSQYVSGIGFFLLTSLITYAWFSVNFIVCGAIAVFFKKRFPLENDVIKRLSFMIVAFLLTTGLFLTGLFNFYDGIPLFNYRFNPNAFAYSYLLLGVISVFLTFLMEGIARYKEWQANRDETEKLSQLYKRSQLQGLKSQVNPHFLFNSLNSLSSLIQSDEEKAENFLDELSVVYRYMLSNDNEQLVSLDAELRFAASYMHILKERFGEGLQLKVQVDPEERDKMLAPLTLQLLIENAFTQNIVCKAEPLSIAIESMADGHLEISNSVQPKTMTDALDFDSGMDNLIKKYELLGRPISVIEQPGSNRVIRLPLIPTTKVRMR